MRSVLLLTIVATCACLAQNQATTSEPRIEIFPVQGNVYMLVGAGANIAVSVGSDGMLLVDQHLHQCTSGAAGRRYWRPSTRAASHSIAIAVPSWKVVRTPGREKIKGTAEHGYLHCGPNGAGHFVKMVHNGIEYGIMAAYAEGLGILRSANVGKKSHEVDAETTPLRDPEHYQYDINLSDVTELWRRGSVISSWLLDLTASALMKDPNMANFGGRVSDSGEGRWTIKAAIDEAVPAHVLTAALFERFSSRGEADFANKIISAMRLCPAMFG